MPTTKTAGREVVSLDTLAKQKRDALPEPTTYELFGVEFTLPPMRALPFELQEKVGDLNDIVGVMKFVLGEPKVREMYTMRLPDDRLGTHRGGVAEAFRAGAGGIAGLLRFLTEYGEALEWDVPHYWPGRSLLELYDGRMSWRELRVFLKGLPLDSLTARAVRGSTPRKSSGLSTGSSPPAWWTPSARTPSQRSRSAATRRRPAASSHLTRSPGPA